MRSLKKLKNMEDYNIHLDQNQPRKEPEEHKKVLHHEEEEIDLRDYINVLLKRKWIIVAIFLIAAITAAIISLVMPQTFEATNLVEVGKTKDKTIENITDIKTIFERKATLKEIHKKLGLSEETSLESVAGRFKIEESGSKFIKIKGWAETPEKAVEVTNTVTQVLLDRHKKLFAETEKTFNVEMESINKSKEKTQTDIERIKTVDIPKTKEEIKRLEQDIQEYEKEIAKRGDIQSDGQGRIIESYINLLAGIKNQKESKERQIIDFENGVRNLEQQLISLDQQIQEKEYEKAYQTKPTEIAIPALPPETRISPKRKQNVMIAGILGLFIGVFWAFGAEYFSKWKTE